VRIAVDAIKAASAPHHFLSVTKGGHSAIVHTGGNEDCHIILRGGRTPELQRGKRGGHLQGARECGACRPADDRLLACQQPEKVRAPERRRRATSPRRSPAATGRICGVDDRKSPEPRPQDLVPGQPLKYGVSITDACIGWDATVEALALLAEAVRARRVKHADEA
jgi:3-deoxy-7-phosphoheptulonate synthase